MEKGETENKKKNSKKFIRNSFFFVLLFILTYYFIFRKIDRRGLQEALRNTNLLFVLIAAILASGYILFEAVNLYRTLKLLNEKVTVKNAIKYAIVGFFFSAITPASTGGQPVQVYYMHKDNISYMHATITILLQSFAYTLMMGLLGLVGYIINYDYISNLGFIEYFFFIGLVVNLALVMVTAVAMFSKKTAQKIVNFIYKILNKINEEKALHFKEKSEIQLAEYHDSARFIANNKSIMIKTFLTAFLQLFTYHSVAFFIYLALGMHHLNYIKIATLQSVLYLSVAILPLPGTVGVNETGFSLLYNPIIAKNIVDSAMLLTRGVSFYLYVVVTGIILLIISLRKKKKDSN